MAICEDAGRYRASARNSSGAIESPFIQVNVLEAPAVSSTLPGGISELGGSVTLTASVQSAGTLAYQWHRNGAALPGRTQPILTISNFVSTDEGRYRVTVTSRDVAAVSDEITPNLSRPEFSLVAPRRNPDGTVEIQANAPPGRAYLLQSSDDLISWSTVSVVQPAQASTLIVDPQGGE